jgi:hypothetical protein
MSTNWKVKRLETENGFVLLRMNTSLDTKIRSASNVVKMTWHFSSENTMTSDLEKFEDLIEPLREREGFSYLAAVLTDVSSRRWVFYVTSPEQFLAELANFVEGYWSFIETDTGFDHGWHLYLTLLNLLDI